MKKFFRNLFANPSHGEIYAGSDLRDSNGFVREAAVKKLISRPDGDSLPILLERLNDWVPQVRTVAKEAVRAHFRMDYLPNWIASIEAVVSLEHARRDDHEPMLREISVYLSRPECLPTLIEVPGVESIRVRRYVFDVQWLASQDDAVRCTLLETALTGNDVVVASRAVSRLETLTLLAQRRHLYRVGCKSSFAAVRCAGVRWFVENPSEVTHSVIREIGLDASSHVRWWCLRWLRSHEGVDKVVSRAEELACDAKTSTRLRRVAMQWLLDTDPEKAMSVSAEWLDDRSPRLRYDALAARLSKTDSSERMHWMQRAFEDPSPSVQRLIFGKAHRGIWAPSIAQVLAKLQLERTPAAVVRVLSLRQLYAPWDWLQCLLEIWPLGVELGAEHALADALTAWPWESRGCSHGPPPVQSSRIAELWFATRGELKSGLKDTIEFHLKTFGLI